MFQRWIIVIGWPRLLCESPNRMRLHLSGYVLAGLWSLVYMPRFAGHGLSGVTAEITRHGDLGLSVILTTLATAVLYAGMQRTRRRTTSLGRMGANWIGGNCKVICC